MTNSKYTILVADDDPDTREIVASAVQMLGFEALQAQDGTQALSLIGQVSIDLAILDIMMPGSSGDDVCKKIKNSIEGPYVPVLMLTAKDNVKDKVNSLENGSDDYLTKPFHYQELQARIKALLRVRELNLRLRQQNEKLERMQQKIIEQERQLLVTQLAGTAAHQLGQPLSAIMLNCYLLETLPADDTRSKKALLAIKSDTKHMADLLERLKTADAKKSDQYHADTKILDI